MTIGTKAQCHIVHIEGQQMQGAAPMGRPTAGEQAGDAAQEAAMAGPRDISELLAQALEAYRRTAAGSDGAAPEGADAGELIAQGFDLVGGRLRNSRLCSRGAKSRTDHHRKNAIFHPNRSH